MLGRLRGQVTGQLHHNTWGVQFSDGDARFLLTLLTAVQSSTGILRTTVTFRDPVLRDPSLLRESSTVDVMMVLCVSMSSLVLLHAPSVVVLSRSLSLFSMSVFVCLPVSGQSFFKCAGNLFFKPAKRTMILISKT